MIDAAHCCANGVTAVQYQMQNKLYELGGKGEDSCNLTPRMIVKT